ncbi:MAG: hypothetical protein COV75_06120 [Candidatus Omnitrophica bacterium CG11_big_fil_rev_8_21_14_0_20_63_9]|nr:MAG: hypothetical protein COV75_06120 [Candidatus Omnitrophica bacterium CG11_big_fil_rev_8_21_14_0_20_63_9]
MDPIGDLRQDHAALRKKLALLESALEIAPEARTVLREMCFSIQRLLQAHCRRELQVFQEAQHVLASSMRLSEVTHHAASLQLVRSVNELLLSGMRASVPIIVLRLSQFIEQLNEQIDAQERSVYPLIAPAGQEPQQVAEGISPGMSVNEILQRFPQTEPIFTQLRINRLREGYESVDELAWRHGIDVSQVLEQLREAVGSS